MCQLVVQTLHAAVRVLAVEGGALKVHGIQGKGLVPTRDPSSALPVHILYTYNAYTPASYCIHTCVTCVHGFCFFNIKYPNDLHKIAAISRLVP